MPRVSFGLSERFLLVGLEALKLDLEFVGAGEQRREGEAAAVVGDRRARVLRPELVMVTVAPGSTPPDASVTVPRTVAVPAPWADAGAGSGQDRQDAEERPPDHPAELPTYDLTCTGSPPKNPIRGLTSSLSGRSITNALVGCQGTD